MEIRYATIDDAVDVLEWRNDPVSVAASKTGTVNLSDHLSWFAKSMHNPNRCLFIVTEGKHRVGMVRFDKIQDAWLVSINIAPAERGKGYGEAALRMAIAKISNSRLLAEIKLDNLASIRIFERCGFRRIGAKDGLLQFERP